jgi:YHS domain-containing protein/transcriptional regulator with XRE-family HTH domain
MHYNTVERPALEELLISFHEDQFIRIDAAGLTPEQIADATQIRLKSDENLPLRPLALQIEGAGDFKSLLTEGVEENHLPRKWSLWKQIDPVALFNGKVIQGTAEFACHFHGNVFVFASEENLKAFLAEPKKYLQARPEMPAIFRVLMLGARGSGRHTQAKLLSQIYGWKIVDFKQLIKQRVEALVKQEIHIPNNPLPGGRIGLSEVELNEIIEGKPVPASKFIPWILDYLGHPLEKKKPPPPEEKPEGEVVEEEVDEETKKKREAEAKKKAIEEEKKRKEEEEKEKAK